MQIKAATPNKLVYENERLATFDKWPLDFIDKEILAKTGFYYIGKDDNVICIFCGVEIGSWERGDNPIEEHRKFSPQCKLLQRLTRTDSVMRKLPRSENECGCVLGRRPTKSIYDTLEARFATYEDWPKSMKQTKKSMAAAGFYYTGNGDKVSCFSCGVGVHQWEEDDDPWVEHAKWNPYCEFVLKEKGENFVKDILNANKRNDRDRHFQTTVVDTPTINDELLCSVCKTEKRTVVSIPCRHLATCKKCNNYLTQCPICRTAEENTIDIYYG